MTSKEVKKELYNQLVSNIRYGTRKDIDEDTYPICLTILRIMRNLNMITEDQRKEFADEIAEIIYSDIDLWGDAEAIKEYDAGYII